MPKTKTPTNAKEAEKPAKARKPARTVDQSDPQFVPVARAFVHAAGFSVMESKSGATRGLMLHGKSFGMSSHGRFVLKFDEERASALIADGVGQPFRPGAGRVMKNWVEITDPEADWVALAREAHRFAAAERQPAVKKSKA